MNENGLCKLEAHAKKAIKANEVRLVRSNCVLEICHRVKNERGALVVAVAKSYSGTLENPLSSLYFITTKEEYLERHEIPYGIRNVLTKEECIKPTIEESTDNAIAIVCFDGQRQEVRLLDRPKSETILTTMTFGGGIVLWPIKRG